MGRTRRDRYIIMYQILELLNREELPKSEIAKRLNILYYSLVKYLEHLEKKGLIRNEYGRYSVTEKGKQMMREIKPLVDELLLKKELAKKLDI